MDQIKQWFETCSQKSFGIELPSGWVGRPYDNAHQLESFQIGKKAITLKLDGKDSLMISGFKEVIFSNNGQDIEFKNLSKLKLSLGGEIKQFSSGNLILHGYFSSSW